MVESLSQSELSTLYSPQNDPDPEMIPKELGNGD